MAELKTKATDGSVEAFLNGIEDERQRADSVRLVELMTEISGEEPTMWGPSIIGFGHQHYQYESGREGDWFVIGFSPRKANLALYNVTNSKEQVKLLNELGKHKTGKSCLYIKRLEHIDLMTLRKMIELAIRRESGDESV